MKASKSSKSSKKVISISKHLSHAQRSAVSRQAGFAAQKFMHSKAYQAIKNSNRTYAAKRKAIEALKERRAA